MSSSAHTAIQYNNIQSKLLPTSLTLLLFQYSIDTFDIAFDHYITGGGTTNKLSTSTGTHWWILVVLLSMIVPGSCPLSRSSYHQLDLTKWPGRICGTSAANVETRSIFQLQIRARAAAINNYTVATWGHCGPHKYTLTELVKLNWCYVRWHMFWFIMSI